MYVARRCAVGEHCPGGVGVVLEVDPSQLRYDIRFVTGGAIFTTIPNHPTLF